MYAYLFLNFALVCFWIFYELKDYFKKKKGWFSFLNKDFFLLVYQGRESHDLSISMLSTCIENSLLGARKVGVGGKGQKEGLLYLYNKLSYYRQVSSGPN